MLMTRLGAASVPAVATALTPIGASILTSTTEVATIVVTRFVATCVCEKPRKRHQKDDSEASRHAHKRATSTASFIWMCITICPVNVYFNCD